ncbi:MAG: hypothetical protein U1F53_02880 [Burkholderiaceae bacterium]
MFATQLRGEADAWRELASEWGLGLGTTSDPCGSAARLGLACFKGASSLAEVRQLDRPGLLVLRDGDGRAFHVLLAALGPDTATLRRGSTRVTVPLASLGAAWRGEFGTFWRTPPGYAGPGSLSGPDSEGGTWLAERLAQVLPAGSASAPLPSRVAAFQVAQGLSPDGLAGPMTLMLLGRATGVDEPRLQPPAAARR